MFNETKTNEVTRIKFGSIALVLSGISFLLFPVIRPFFDESNFSSARNYFASYTWVLAHSFGMFGFIFLSLGFFTIYLFLRNTEMESRAFKATIISWIGTGLTLPFFGAEAFSLQVIGQASIDQGNPNLISLVDLVRFGPGIIFIGIGLILIAIASILLASAIWNSNSLPKWSGVPLAIGFILYMPILNGLPIFQPIRIIDAILILVSCIWIAWKMITAEISN